jgi:hypothetical protein
VRTASGGGLRAPQALGDLIGPALKSLGLPSRRAGERLRRAWQVAADPAWAGLAQPLGIDGGVLRVGVTSSALRHELTGFHADRLLRVLQRALPDTPLVALRFEASADPFGVA